MTDADLFPLLCQLLFVASTSVTALATVAGWLGIGRGTATEPGLPWAEEIE